LYDGRVKVRADAAVCDYVTERGGTLWVRTTCQHCCHGAVTSLRASTARPRDAVSYAPVDAELPITVRFKAAGGGPEELVLELRGIARKRPVAFWDGCKFKI
jgi:hypothetical protein